MAASLVYSKVSLRLRGNGAAWIEVAVSLLICLKWLFGYDEVSDLSTTLSAPPPHPPPTPSSSRPTTRSCT